jgi:hypothetical protein
VFDAVVAGLPDAATYRDVCVALRQEHDREVAISQQLQVRLPPCVMIAQLAAILPLHHSLPPIRHVLSLLVLVVF